MKKRKNGLKLAEVAKKATMMVGITAAGVIGSVNEKIFASAGDFLKEDGNKTFDKITSTVKDTGASFYRLLQSVGIIGLVISIIFVGISFATNKNAAKREESKSHMLYIAIGAVIIFGALSLLSLFQTIGKGLE